MKTFNKIFHAYFFRFILVPLDAPCRAPFTKFLNWPAAFARFLHTQKKTTFFESGQSRHSHGSMPLQLILYVAGFNCRYLENRSKAHTVCSDISHSAVCRRTGLAYPSSSCRLSLSATTKPPVHNMTNGELPHSRTRITTVQILKGCTALTLDLYSAPGSFGPTSSGLWMPEPPAAIVTQAVDHGSI